VQSKDTSLLDLIVSQRDRFQQRISQLEDVKFVFVDYIVFIHAMDKGTQCGGEK
jgi:hypothetical protein